MFADDVMASLRNSRSIEALFYSTDLFSKYSGLEITSDKTESAVLVNEVSSTIKNVISFKNIRDGHHQNFR